MKPRLSKFIIRTVLNPKAKNGDPIGHYSDYDLAKGWYELKELAWGLVIDFGLISIGVISAGFGLKGFLLNNGFLDGGATGISL